LDNFSLNYNQKFGYFDNFSSKIHEAINEQKNIKYNSKLLMQLFNGNFSISLTNAQSVMLQKRTARFRGKSSEYVAIHESIIKITDYYYPYCRFDHSCIVHSRKFSVPALTWKIGHFV